MITFRMLLLECELKALSLCNCYQVAGQVTGQVTRQVAGQVTRQVTGQVMLLI